MNDVYDDYPLTKEQIEALLINNPKSEESEEEEDKKKEADTDQEDVPFDVLKNFPDSPYFKLPQKQTVSGCPRCGQNGAREQVQVKTGNATSLRFKCVSCGHESWSYT